MSEGPQFDSPKLVAGVKLIERTGARNIRIGYSDEADGVPVVWYATATWFVRSGRPVADARGGAQSRHEAAGAMNGITAVMRLCEQIIDGGMCLHCERPTIFDDNPGDSPFDDLLEAMGCVYAWDPELATFRRGCEGDHE
jgi:hypothetical protein